MDNSANPRWYVKTSVKKHGGGMEAPFYSMRTKRLNVMSAVQQKQLAKAENDKSNR